MRQELAGAESQAEVSACGDAEFAVRRITRTQIARSFDLRTSLAVVSPAMSAVRVKPDANEHSNSLLLGLMASTGLLLEFLTTQSKQQTRKLASGTACDGDDSRRQRPPGTITTAAIKTNSVTCLENERKDSLLPYPAQIRLQKRSGPAHQHRFPPIAAQTK